MKFNDMKISSRLSLLSGFLILAVILIGINGWYTLNKSNQEANEVINNSRLIETTIDTARKVQVDFKIQVQEWKNILLRGNNADAFKKHQTGFNKKAENTQEGLNELRALYIKLKLNPNTVDDALQTQRDLLVKYKDALNKYDTADPASGQTVDSLVKGMDREPTAKIDIIVKDVQEHSTKITQDSSEYLTNSIRSSNYISFSIILITVFICILLTYLTIINITTPLKRAVEIAQTVASGDLTSIIEVNSQDETGQLLKALKDMNSNLTGLVNEVRNGTASIHTGSTEIAQGNLELSSRTEEQAGSIEETAAAMEELTSTVSQNGENTKLANNMANSTSQIATKGGKVVNEVISTMQSINESSNKIVDIIGVIDGIAFQTNILALNAAVEAARAGEQGRGFAVVASEVRSLAQRSASAAKEIKLLINDSVEKVNAGSKLVNQAGITMDEILGSVKNLSVTINEIAEANSEQSSGINQINQAIISLEQTTQQNAALVEEAAAAAESLKNQADHLENTVSQFKINSAPKRMTQNHLKLGR
jgi:methyl-accepting chemotaxis protein